MKIVIKAVERKQDVIMQQKIPILVISLKKSTRIIFLEERMKKLKLKFNIVYGVNGVNYEKKKKIKIISDQDKIFKNIGRKMSAPEIGASASHLKVYKYIIRNGLTQCIVMEDDAFPSVLLKEWACSNNEVGNDEILSFYSYANGFVYKKIFRSFFHKINIYKSKTHLFSSSCYQININTCKKIIDLTGSKVNNIPDWPVNLENNKINLYVTIPFVALIDDKNVSYLNESRNKILETISSPYKKKNSKNIYWNTSQPLYTNFIEIFFGQRWKF